MIKFNRKEKIAAILICLMKRNNGEFPVCKWNDFIIKLLNKTGVDANEFSKKIYAAIDVLKEGDI